MEWGKYGCGCFINKKYSVNLNIASHGFNPNIIHCSKVLLIYCSLLLRPNIFNPMS